MTLLRPSRGRLDIFFFNFRRNELVFKSYINLLLYKGDAAFCNAAQKVRLGTKQGIAKLEKLSKMDSERAAHDHFETKLNDIWYDLALDEAICLTIYAIAFDTDKTARLTHLRRARRTLGIITPSLEKCKAGKATKDSESNAVLKYGKDITHESTKGYVADDDVLLGGKKDALDRLNTKRIRGGREEKTGSGKGIEASGIVVCR